MRLSNFDAKGTSQSNINASCEGRDRLNNTPLMFIENLKKYIMKRYFIFSWNFPKYLTIFIRNCLCLTPCVCLTFEIFPA